MNQLNWEGLISTACCLWATWVGLFQVLTHLWFNSQPKVQILVCKVILTVPVTYIKIYALTTMFSLLYPQLNLLFTGVRDCYEAYIIYIFAKLIIECHGGELNLLCDFWEQKKFSQPWMFKFFPDIALHENTLQKIKLGTLQFVFLRPITSIIAIAMQQYGFYNEGSLSLYDSYIYIAIIDNIAITAALYALLVLFFVCKQSPVAHKFLCIKFLVFCTYWQSGLLLISEQYGLIKSAEELGVGLMSFEIAFASIMFWKAFPYQEFSTGQGRTHIVTGMGKVLSVKELMDEARLAFKSYELDYSVHKDVWEESN